jgi:SHOCT-like protein
MSTQTIPLEGEALVTIAQVGGDCAVQGWDRSELQARGDMIRIEKQDASVALSSSGDVVVSVPRGIRLSINTIGGDVRLEDLSGAVELGVIGGDTQLRNLSGAVRVNGPLGGEIHMENVANISMGTPAGAADFDIGERIRRSVLHATHRADKKLRKAQIKMARAGGGSWMYNSAPDSSAPAQPGEPVAEEERMTILRMLQEKKITSEQAEKLLAALEGNI